MVRDVRQAAPFISGRVRRCYGAKVEWCEGAVVRWCRIPSGFALSRFSHRRSSLLLVEWCHGAGSRQALLLGKLKDERETRQASPFISGRVRRCYGEVVRWCGMFDRLRPSSAAGCEGAMVRRWSGARVRDLIRLWPFAFSHRPSPIVLTCGGEVLSSHREVRDVRLASPFT
jgi:hypothetical protein